MAKKASKTRARRNTRTRKAAEEAAVTPNLLEKGKSIQIGLHDVIRALNMVAKHGHLRKLVTASKRQKLQVRIPADTVNFAKKFVLEHRMHKDPVGKHIVFGKGRAAAKGATATLAAAPTAVASGDPNQCDFGR